MRKYEFMVVFTTEEDLYKVGIESVRKILADFGVETEKEEPYGDRSLCYMIKKKNRGRYVLFNIKANPSSIVDIESQVRLNTSVLTSLFVRVDE